MLIFKTYLKNLTSFESKSYFEYRASKKIICTSFVSKSILYIMKMVLDLQI